MTVEVLNSRAYLHYVALHFQLVQALPPSEELVQRLILTKLQQDVHVLCIFKEMFESDDIIMMKGSVDLDLGHQLLLGAGLGERSLGDDLGGRHALRLQVGELVALGESSLSQKFTS